MAKIRIFTIGDLHLSKGADKNMDVFGGVWEGYMEKIEKNFCAIVEEKDIVILPGDISWAMDLKNAISDFTFLDGLPGKKYILKGNHDYWWSTRKKMEEFLEENNFSTISFIHNDCIMLGETALCGTRGWIMEERSADENDKKIIKRESGRLKESLECAKRKNAKEIFAFLHYPPIYDTLELPEMTDLLKEYGVSECFYGHLHSASFRKAFNGKKDGVKYTLVSADYLNFVPHFIKKL